MSVAECEQLADEGYGNDRERCSNASSADTNLNYWAGAVKLCGGVQNLPSASDIAIIANLGEDKVAELGLYGGSVFGRDEGSGNYPGVYAGSFSIWDFGGYGVGGAGNMFTSYTQTICKLSAP